MLPIYICCLTPGNRPGPPRLVGADHTFAVHCVDMFLLRKLGQESRLLPGQNVQAPHSAMSAHLAKRCQMPGHPNIVNPYQAQDTSWTLTAIEGTSTDQTTRRAARSDALTIQPYYIVVTSIYTFPRSAGINRGTHGRWRPPRIPHSDEGWREIRSHLTISCSSRRYL